MTVDAVDFYVEALAHFASQDRTWVIRVGRQSPFVRVHSDPIEATADAIRMAQYRVDGGRAAQVHVRDEAEAPWRTVWCPAGSAPRYP